MGVNGCEWHGRVAWVHGMDGWTDASHGAGARVHCMAWTMMRRTGRAHGRVGMARACTAGVRRMARAAHGCILAWHGCAGASHGWYGCHCFAWMGCTDHICTDGTCTHARAPKRCRWRRGSGWSTSTARPTRPPTCLSCSRCASSRVTEYNVM